VTQNKLIANEERLDVVMKDNKKDIEELQQQTKLKHTTLVDQIQAWYDLLKINTKTAEIAQIEVLKRH
jgi:hypothetical protein